MSFNRGRLFIIQNVLNISQLIFKDHFFYKVHPGRIGMIFVTISSWLVVGALFMQVFMQISPCELCLWQRVPHFIVMFGAVLIPLRFFRFTLMMQAMAYAANMLLAGYHSGVERKWWDGPHGCSMSNIDQLSIAELQAQLMNTAITKCDEISWNLFGLSLTNYNFLICLFLAIMAICIVKGYEREKNHV